MKCYKVRWDCLDPEENCKIYSVVSYDLTSAEQRKAMLEDQHRTGIEIVRVKPGTDEVIEVL